MVKDVKGFTLLELMIAVSLGVILLGIGAPAMSSLLNENTLQFESRTVLKHLRFARSQAVDNQQSVTACLANASDNCVTASPTQILIFVDNDGNNVLNNGEQFLARSPTFPRSLTASNNRISTTFSPDGTSLVTNATLSLCSPGNAQINLVIAPSGRTTQSTQANICP
ncbi:MULTISPECIES: GspH/FimT family pseudopilin [Aeromonas]|uniref:GspH/FimT family pseudopilin n=1 Tax=Aeromonas TaxID=642 RepID=UPI00051BC744|nr:MULTISPECIES: GspH/FimT family pseudopilin [Aeromonas]MCH7371456.1 GspH/FimT family pseudopilin [Aeromonas sp. MR16]